MNAATQLLRLLLERGDYLERFTNEELSALLPIIERAHTEVLGKVASRPAGDYRDWLAEEAANIGDIYATAVKELKSVCFDDLEELARQESTSIDTMLRTVYAGVGFTTPSAAGLWAGIKALPAAAGSTLDKLFEALEIAAPADVIQALQVGMAEGETTDQLVRRIRGEVVKRAVWRKDADGVRRYHAGTYSGGAMTGSTRDAEMLVRTAVIHTGNQAREAFYADNLDVIKGFQRYETLDVATCIVCGIEDGRFYKSDEARPQLPAHYDCRGGYCPVVKSFRELGIEADELSPSTRASMDGQVPESTTWRDVVAKASHDRRVEILGPARAKLYEDGMSLDKMVKGGQLVPLKDLAAK